jgi:potassium efflux system protein
MKQAQAKHFAIFLLSILLAGTGYAQESEEAPPPEIPNIAELHNSGWAFFEGPKAEVELRADVFFAEVEAGIAELEPQNEQTGNTLLIALRGNISAYIALLDEPELLPRGLGPVHVEYSIDELLQIAGAAREAESEAREELLEVEREQRVLAGASKRRDTAFGNYVDAAAGDERWLTGMRLLKARSAQAISARRLKLLTLRFENSNAFADATAARVDLAKESLATSLETAELQEIADSVVAFRALVETANEELRTAQLAATSLEFDTADGRSQQRLLQQGVRGAEVSLALAQMDLAQAEAKRRWLQLKLDTSPNMNRVSDQMLAWSEFLRETDSQAPEWQLSTQEELLAVQSANRDDLSRAARRVLDQRLGTAQETLTQIGSLQMAAEDLRLLTAAVELVASEQTGAIGTLLTNIKIGLKTVYKRGASLADATLFSIGEAPVAGRDIFRVLLIMAAAMLLSRGIRHTIRRVGHGESSGTQASLYTVGRLTHYVIIIFAVFIALSSVGIEFGNLALVAGALSVGIGFGLQSIVNNFVSGLIILFEHSLRVGDYIELDTGLTGTVKSINVRSTLINTNDNIDIVVPNSEFVTARLQNWTLGERILRVRIPFGVAYGSDKDLVKQAALEAAAEVPYTLTHMKGREPDAWLTEFGDNSLNFLLLVWVNRQGARRPTRTRSAYLWALETKLTEHGIEIPFPQRDLHLRTGWADVTTSQLAQQQQDERDADADAPNNS